MNLDCIVLFAILVVYLNILALTLSPAVLLRVLGHLFDRQS